MNDLDIYGKDEVWAYPERRRRLRGLCAGEAPGLMRARLSLSNLLVTVVRKPDGEGHAVLTVAPTRAISCSTI